MNARDKQRMMRLRIALDTVPFPHRGGGYASPSVAGVAQHTEDMVYVMGFVSKFLLTISVDFPGEWEGLIFPDAGDALRELEQWVSKRKREGWE